MKKILLLLAMLPLMMAAQDKKTQLMQCPVLFENGNIVCYTSLRAGNHFQHLPDRKPNYVHFNPSPWLATMQQSVDETRGSILSELSAQVRQQRQTTMDKQIFLRKMAWTVLLQYRKTREIEKPLLDYLKVLTQDQEQGISDDAKLVQRLVDDYGGLK